MVRPENIAMLQDTLDILEQGYYLVGGKKVELKLSKDEMREIDVYLPGEIQAISESRDFSHGHHAERLVTSCENRDAFSLAIEKTREACTLPGRNGKPVLVLNLANPVNPGGGVRRGATAQEENLCRKSSLLLSLESPDAAAYYNYNKSLRTYMGSDAVMITPQVEIVKDERGNLLPESVIVSVMTCAAPMVKRGMEGMTNQAYRDLVYRRICGMLKVAVHLGYEMLVLGAFGCGAFGNDAHVISDLFRKALKAFDFDGKRAEDCFWRVDFAVLDLTARKYNFREFARNFEDFYRDEEERKTDQAPDTKPSCTFFWRDDEKNGEFSNWYIRKFVIDDFQYFCVEQYMMAQKAKLFHDAERYTAVLRANTPAGCKALGKQVKPFVAEEWDAVKFDIVKRANRAKYMQNPDLMRILLSTEDSILAEASPKDAVWGIGLTAAAAEKTDPSDWPGENLFGKVLMELRDEFRRELQDEIRGEVRER